MATTTLDLITPAQELTKKKTSRSKSVPYRSATMTAEQFEQLTDGRQLEVPVNDKQNSRCNDN